MIHCHRCKTQNPPEALKCSQCNADLLPGYGMGERLGALITTLVLSGACIGVTVLFLKPDIGLWIVVIGVVVLLVGFGLYWTFRKTRLHERYEIRAKRHVKLDPLQAITDYASAIKHAPETDAFDLLQTRAKLCSSHNMPEEARSDWQRALENINSRILKGKDTDLELHKKRAETYQHLGMQDEYALEMLGYTIIKEQGLKTARKEIATDIKGGIQKGSDDAKRDELAKLRAPVLGNPRYAIVGYCKQCGTTVELDKHLECSNNPKHRSISNIAPILKPGVK